MDNLLSYCGLVDARISTSDKDLPVLAITQYPELFDAYQYVIIINSHNIYFQGIFSSCCV